MGSGGLFKTIINLNKAKNNASKKGSTGKSDGFKWKTLKANNHFASKSTGGKLNTLGMPNEDVAATRIQTAFRAYMARKSFRRLKQTARLQAQIKNLPVKKQANSTLHHLHTWCKIQEQIRVRRVCMVVEGQLKQKKVENQMKLEAKLHDVEVEWSSGPETKEEVLTRIHQREEAAVKRERAMAYAFSHQARASSNHNGFRNHELAKANWGWSWVERWIAARPWESRLPTQSNTPVLKNSVSPSPKASNNMKKVNRHASKVGRSSVSPSPKASIPVKAPQSNGKETKKARRLTYPGAEKPTAKSKSVETEETNLRKEQIPSSNLGN